MPLVSHAPPLISGWWLALPERRPRRPLRRSPGRAFPNPVVEWRSGPRRGYCAYWTGCATSERHGHRTRARSATAAAPILVAAVLTACATTTPSAPEPDTEKQRKARSDLEQCNVAAGNKAHGLTVSPEGNYSFQVTGVSNANAILACMTGKGYSGVRVDNTIDHGGPDLKRSGGEGQALR